MVIREGAGAGSEHPVDGELILGREHGSADLVIDDRVGMPGSEGSVP